MLKFGGLKALLRLLWKDMTLAKALIIKRVQHYPVKGYSMTYLLPAKDCDTQLLVAAKGLEAT